MYCSQHWNGVLSGYFHKMVESSLGRHSIRSHMVLDIPLGTKNTRQESLSSLKLQNMIISNF